MFYKNYFNIIGVILVCHIIALKADLILSNKSNHYVRFREQPQSCERDKAAGNEYKPLDYRLAPNDKVRMAIRGNFPKGSLFEVVYYSSIDKDGFARFRGHSYKPLNDAMFVGTLNASQSARFQTPDDEYGTLLKKSEKIVPEMIITHNVKTNKPVINVPQTTKELKAELEKIEANKEEKNSQKTAQAGISVAYRN